MDAFSFQATGVTIPAAEMAEKKLEQGDFKQAVDYARKASFHNRNDLTACGVEGVVLAFGGQTKAALAKIDFLKDHPDDGFYINLIRALVNAQDGKIQKAEQYLAASLQTRPDHSFANYYRGSLYLVQKKYETSILYFEKVLSRQKTFVPALAGMGQAHLRLEHMETAIGYYEKAVQIDPDNMLYGRQLLDLYRTTGKQALADRQIKRILYFVPGVKSGYLQKGYELLVMGAYAEARDLMDKIIPVYKDIPLAFYIKAAASANIGETANTEYNLRKFLETQKNNPLAYHYAGMCYLALGLYGKAETHFTKVISLNPSFGKSFVPLTIIEQINGNFSPARTGLDLAAQLGEPVALIEYLSAHIALEQNDTTMFFQNMKGAAKLIPGMSYNTEGEFPGGKTKAVFAKKRNLMILFFLNGWYGKTLEISRQLLEIDGKDRFALYYKALCETARNDNEKAMTSYLDLLKIDPGIYSAHMGLGLLYLKKKDVEKAISSFNRVIEINQGIGQAYLYLGDIYNRRQNRAEAIENYLQALENNARAEMVYPRLILLLVQADEGVAKAEKYCEELEALSPHDPYSLDTLGWANLKFQKKEKGLEMIRRAYAMAPHDPVILYHLGIAHYEQNDFDSAKRFLTASTEKSKKFPGYKNARSILKMLNGGD